MKRMYILLFIIISYSLIYSQDWQVANGTSGNPIAAISIYQSDPDTIFALGAGYQYGTGLFRSTDGGSSWDSIGDRGTDIGALKVDQFNSKLLYASVFGYDLESNNIEISTDGGLTWEVVYIGRVDPAPVVEIDPIDNKTVYVGVGPSFIYRTTDQGESWDTLGAQPPAAYYLWPLTSFVIAPSNDSILYAGYTTGIFKSTDKGNTWQTLDLGFAIHSGTYLAVHPASSEIVYAAITSSSNYSGSIYKSTDGGQSWQEADSGISGQNKDIMSMTINPKNPNQIFAGLYGEGNLFWRSMNGGESWTEYSSGLPVSSMVKCIEVDTANNRIFCGTNSGLYFTDLITDVKYPATDVSYNFHLSQNYPNPFNPRTIIKYSLGKEGHVQLVIFDALGQKIEEFVNTIQQAGEYSIDFNASGISSGVYFYQLRSDGLVQTKKMIITR